MSEPTEPTALSEGIDTAAAAGDAGEDVIAIPPDLLAHPRIKDHPAILELHETHGGVPPDADDSTLSMILDFTKDVAAPNVDPSKMRRSDPSPRRSARVFRAEVLGHREPSVSPERRRSVSATRRGRDVSVDSSRSSGNGDAAVDEMLHSRSRSRYRSRSRAPTTIVEEEEGGRGWERRVHGTGEPGRRDTPDPNAGDVNRQLENRLKTITQQQHSFQDRLMLAISALEDEYAQIQARNTNRVNYYLGEPLVPVTNGKTPVPRHLPGLTSVEVIQSLPGKDVRAWLAYYTGRSAQQILEADRRAGYTGGDQDWCSQDLRRALRACTGVEPVFML